MSRFRNPLNHALTDSVLSSHRDTERQSHPWQNFDGTTVIFLFLITFFYVMAVLSKVHGTALLGLWYKHRHFSGITEVIQLGSSYITMHLPSSTSLMWITELSVYVKAKYLTVRRGWITLSRKHCFLLVILYSTISPAQWFIILMQRFCWLLLFNVFLWKATHMNQGSHFP